MSNSAAFIAHIQPYRLRQCISHNLNAGNKNAMSNSDSAAGLHGPFQPGSMILITLGGPREKFWGALLSITAAGVSLVGIELASFEDLVAMVKETEPASPGVVFFPMHRIERVELDLPDGSIPSLTQRFLAKTGRDPRQLLLAASREQPDQAATGSAPGSSGTRP